MAMPDIFSNMPRFILRAGLLLLAFVLLVYYPLGMLIIHKIHDDVDFALEAPIAEGSSETVAVATALLERELDTHWAPNDPFFYPSYALVRMSAYQRGIASGIARFALALSDQLARTRGSSSADADVQKATGLLNYPPTVWIYDTSVSWLPTASSESQYRAGIESLRKYNARVSQGLAVFERRSDNLLETIDRLSLDLGAASGAIDQFVHNRSALAFLPAARLYYETKGKLYIYSQLMRALKRDFATVIAEKQLTPLWDQAIRTLEEGTALELLLVINADADNQLLPSHLAAQGFYVLRARTQMREITNILLK